MSGHHPYIIMIAGINGQGKRRRSASSPNTSSRTANRCCSLPGHLPCRRPRAVADLGRTQQRDRHLAGKRRPGGRHLRCHWCAKARGIDIVLADTAGRLPTQLHLMEEIAKVRRVIQKAEPSGPHETLLVLDANIGQNALAQVKAFDKAIHVTGLVVTKLDGTAKGGVLAAIARQSPKPVRFIGIGEGIDDLRPFVARDFVDAMFE